jgi:spore coat polysaccharide biosynthesis predicted glycosyltransferase SpsG
VAVRGGRRVIETGLGLGADVIPGATPRILGLLRPDVVIVDDPVVATARRWITAARRAGALVVTVHDLGLGCRESDLVIDGSVTRTPRGRRGQELLTGSRYAVLNPSLTRAIAERRRAVTPAAGAAPRVVIALGGGPRLKLAGAIADAIVAAVPAAEVRIASGFVVAPRPRSSNVVWIGASRGIAAALEDASVAVVGGGVSLYESCALGVPTVGVPVVTAQVPTVRAFARRGAAVETPYGAPAAVVAGKVVSLLKSRARRRLMARRARQLVDGRGAGRAAGAVIALSNHPRRASL